MVLYSISFKFCGKFLICAIVLNCLLKGRSVKSFPKSLKLATWSLLFSAIISAADDTLLRATSLSKVFFPYTFFSVAWRTIIEPLECSFWVLLNINWNNSFFSAFFLVVYLAACNCMLWFLLRCPRITFVLCAQLNDNPSSLFQRYSYVLKLASFTPDLLMKPSVNIKGNGKIPETKKG